MEIHSQNIATPAPYVGGKRLLSKVIVPLLQNIPHKLYAEPFVGMGGVFLRKSSKHVKDVINDINGDIYTLFRVFETPSIIRRLFFERLEPFTRWVIQGHRRGNS